MVQAVMLTAVRKCKNLVLRRLPSMMGAVVRLEAPVISGRRDVIAADRCVLCLFDLPTSTTALRSRLEPDLPTYHHPPDGPGVPDLPTYPLLHCKKGCNISATKAWVSEGPSSIGWVLVIGPAHS